MSKVRVTRMCKHGIRWAAVTLLWATWGQRCASADLSTSSAQQIVVLYDERPELPGLSVLDASISRTLTAKFPGRIEVYREAMDLSRFDSPAYRDLLRDHLRAKYAGSWVDAIVATMEPSLDFLLEQRDEIFPGVPIVFCGIDRRQFGNRTLPPDVTGVLVKREFAPTVELALRLHPGTEQIVVVAGSTAFDRRILAQAREEFRPFESRFKFTYLTNLALPEILAQVSNLPPRTVLLYTTMFRDGAGEPCVPHLVAERLSAAANAPLYGFVDQYLGRGIVGGWLYGLGAHGEAAAGLVLKVLAGAKPAEIPPIAPASSATAFDWRQLQRWGIKDSQLPAGSTVQFRTPSIWSHYKFFVLGATAIVLLQGATIGGLLWQRARQRRSQAQLAESEERFRSMADRAPIMIWVTGLDKGSTYLNNVWCDFRGRSMEQELGSGWADGVHPEDQDRAIEVYSTAFDARVSFSMEYRLRRHDGVYRWIMDQGTPRYAADGTFLGYVGCCIDLTDRRHAEAELREGRERMELAAEAAHLGLWIWDVPANKTWVSEKCREMFAFPRNGDITCEAFLQRVHPDDRQTAEEAVRMAMARKAPYHTEYRLLLPDQTVRWIDSSGRVDFDSGGNAMRMLGVCIDVSARRRAEEAARELSGRLIHAQEDERRRIARDLHDDLNQQIALLSVEMELLARETSATQEQRSHHIEQVAARIKGLSSEVHKLSYQLHPAKLDQLGLVAAARSFCRELAQQSGLKIDFAQKHVPRDLSDEISLCTYRIIQESLQNVVRHGGASAAEVRLHCEGGHLKLLIADTGNGFDLEAARRRGGLGLISMEERARLVHGTFLIYSHPGEGTHIKLSIPLHSAPKA